MESPRRSACIKSWNRISKEDDMGNCATVVELCGAHLKSHPKHVPTMILLASSFTRCGHFFKAERLLEKAGKLWPQKHHTVIYWKWGELEAVRGNYPAAMKWHRKAAQQSPDDATAGIFCGHIAFRQGKISLWEKYERRVLECSEGALDEAWLNLGSALHTQGRLEEARDCYLKAIAIDPKYAIAKKRLKDVEQAIQLRQKARSGNEGKSRRSSVAAKK